ncbi:MAG: response regulator [Thermodesulfobacterium sp.]|nr:response regulator [Thermodesulfobacterium sp.]
MSKLILLVDDSKTMLMSLKMTLELNGYQVETATNGKEAIDKLKKGLKPDLIITDLNMPVMNGLEFVKEARPTLKFVPILILTTESEISKREEAKKLGATGWLVKPLSGQDLIKVIKKVLP